MTTRREVLQFQPTNLGANGVFSVSRNGLQQVVFQVSALPRVMLGRTLRVNGKMKVLNSSNAFPTNATTFLAEQPTDTAFSIDGRIGPSSCIDTLSVSNLKGSVYANVKNYNRLMSSLVPLNQSFNNYINGSDEEFGCGKQITQAKHCDKEFSFSIPLLDGFIQQNIDMKLVDGLIITITLAPDSFVIHNNYWYNQNATIPQGAYYEWSDLVLSFDTEVPNQAGVDALMANRTGMMSYKTYSSFYNVVISNQQNYTALPNTRQTTACIGNFVPSEWLNNYAYNSSMTPQLLYRKANQVLNNNIRMNSFTYDRSSVRLPYDFEIKSEGTQAKGTADSVKNYTELNAIRDDWEIYNFLKSLETELSNPLSDTQRNKFDRDRYAINFVDKENCYSIGVSYDKFSNGINFKDQVFSLRIQSELPADQEFPATSMFLFFEHENQVLFKDGMVTIMS